MRIEVLNIYFQYNKNPYIFAFHIIPGVYKVPHFPPLLGGGEFIQSFGEEFKVVKNSFWVEYHVEKRLRRSNIICSIILRL